MGQAFTTCTTRPTRTSHELAGLVILGPRQAALREKFPVGDRLVVLCKPVKMKEVRARSTGTHSSGSR